MLSTVGTALLGILFWAAAAHFFSRSAVGRGAAEVSAMTLLALIAQLNFSYAFVRFLPEAGSQARRAVLSGYAVCGTLAAIAATVFVITPLRKGIVPGDWEPAVLFAVAVVLWTIFVVQDGVLTGLRRTVWVPIENLLFSAAKLLLLPVLALVSADHGVFLSWTIPVVVAVAGVSAVLFLRVVPPRSMGAGPDSAARGRWHPRAVASFLGAQYVISIASAAGAFLVPLIVIKELGAAANAHFYLPWIVGIAFNNLFGNVVASFVVEASHREEPFRELFWRAARLTALIAAGGLVLTAGLGPLLLRLLSRDYADSGATLMRLVGFTLPFGAILALFTSSLWISHRLWLLAAVEVAETVLVIGLTYAFIDDVGIDAAGIATIATAALVGLLSLPFLVRWYRRHSRGAEPPPTTLWLDPAPPT